MKILLLGASGMIAPNIIPELEQHYEFVLSDIQPYPDGRDILHLDVTDYEQVRDAARGVDVIMNYTVNRHDPDLSFHVNTRGAWNVMRAAAELDIRRVLHSGPQCIRSHYDHDFDVADVPRSPGTWIYGLTKTLSYEIVRTYALEFGIETINFVFNGLGPRPEPSDKPRDFPPMTIIWEDLAHAIKLALELETVPDGYQEFNMFSYEGHGKYSLDKARRILGFEPLENWESYFKRTP